MRRWAIWHRVIGIFTDRLIDLLENVSSYCEYEKNLRIFLLQN